MEVVEFPVYRKYHNGHSYFKVINDHQFEEVKKMPEGYQLFSFEVKILPDRNFINDMLYAYREHWEIISAVEYEAIKKLAKN